MAGPGDTWMGRMRDSAGVADNTPVPTTELTLSNKLQMKSSLALYQIFTPISDGFPESIRVNSLSTGKQL